MSPAPWAAHFGLARTPFGKSIPARDLFTRQAHAEAIARISFCIAERALGVVTGKSGRARPSRCAPPSPPSTPPGHQVIYLRQPDDSAPAVISSLS